jgi:hypothetical protein
MRMATAASLLVHVALVSGFVTLKKNTLTGNTRLHHFAAANSKRPRFIAKYTFASPEGTRQLFFVKTAAGKIVSLEYNKFMQSTEGKAGLQDLETNYKVVDQTDVSQGQRSREDQTPRCTSRLNGTNRTHFRKPVCLLQQLQDH